MSNNKQFTTSDFQRLLGELYSLQRLGIKTGLEHTKHLLKACGNPHHKISFIHLAGTNGKGSTAAMIFSILRELGLKTGLYTSPHLKHFNERIRVDGIPISNNNIVKFMDMFGRDVLRIESTFFETTTALAFWYFQQQNVDIAIIETGLGGRLDSTNVITPAVSIITSISLDHLDILGNDIENIAAEKAGIIKNNIPVISDRQSNEVQTVLEKKVREMNTSIEYIKPNVDFSVTIEGTYFNWRNSNFFTPLIGKHQVNNVVLALSAVRQIAGKISNNIIQTGLKNLSWPGRFQVLSANPLVVYDVAHNEGGLLCALDTITTIVKKKPIGLFVLKKNKELDIIIDGIRNQFEDLIVSDDGGNQLIDADSLTNFFQRLGVTVTSIPNIANALTLFESSTNASTPGLIFGSHYIADAVFDHFQFHFDKGYI